MACAFRVPVMVFVESRFPFYLFMIKWLNFTTQYTGVGPPVLVYPRCNFGVNFRDF